MNDRRSSILFRAIFHFGNQFSQALAFPERSFTVHVRCRSWLARYCPNPYVLQVGECTCSNLISFSVVTKTSYKKYDFAYSRSYLSATVRPQVLYGHCSAFLVKDMRPPDWNGKLQESPWLGFLPHSGRAHKSDFG